MDESIELDDKLGPSQVDFIVCPTAPTPPPTQKAVSEQSPVDTYMNDVFTVPASLAGLPAISIPFPIAVEHRISGRPDFAGIQIIGQYSDDSRVLGAARELEKLVQVATSAAPTEEPLVKVFDWGIKKHEVQPKPRKLASVALPKTWIAKLKMDTWKARQRQSHNLPLYYYYQYQQHLQVQKLLLQCFQKQLRRRRNESMKSSRML